ncbi:MAG: peptidoglycan DD-metalloendopeptidase family protein [Gemmatimonadetes bacterium]|nr:peptidoglycan DD-metalloendopeptidase family protein [Gemmatimonadota bacterium]NNM06353.1 peptidoglycan DD-metalloendopeptidase family protein [Gemmatimonadota bacterium]
MGRRVLFVLLGVALLSHAAPAAGQDPELQRQIQESQRRLEAIREERARLQAEMDQIMGRVRDASSELRNIEQRLSASRSVLTELDFQAEAVAQQVQVTTAELLRTREELREDKAVLHRRVRDIYKRGPLHSLKVLLGADSFSNLLTRYRYLRLIATYDRGLVDRVGQQERALEELGGQQRESLAELGRLRQTKLGEVAELRSVERARQSALEQFQDRERQALTRLEQLDADEAQLTTLIDDLERRRLEEERRRALSGLGREGPSTLSGTDAGSLDWPVDGELIYRFGREQRPNGTVLRWNGIGIRAATGTPVQAVKAGSVVLAGPFEGYGPTVVLSHGGGFYTLYLYLEEIGVVLGGEVDAGQIVGTVGGSQTPEGPHIEFQIRAPVSGGAPQAMDPLQWLKGRFPGS